MLSRQEIKRLLLYLKDDHAAQDLTSAITPLERAKAVIRANESCVLAGIEEAAFLFESQGLQIRALKKDGTKLSKGPVLEILGRNRDILRVERIALNVLGRMSGVATLCKEARKIAGKRTKIALTRKTVPGFNLFDKKAARIAGVWPHRMNLEEAILFKENHLGFFKTLADAISVGKKAGKTVEIEVENERQALEAAESEPDILMLDNFSLFQAKRTLSKVRRVSPKTRIELSGGITRTNLGRFSALKPDILSVGYLTKNAKMVDFSLDMIPD